jgi:hypothetical protein
MGFVFLTLALAMSLSNAIAASLDTVQVRTQMAEVEKQIAELEKLPSACPLTTTVPCDASACVSSVKDSSEKIRNMFTEVNKLIATDAVGHFNVEQQGKQVAQNAAGSNCRTTNLGGGEVAYEATDSAGFITEVAGCGGDQSQMLKSVSGLSSNSAAVQSQSAQISQRIRGVSVACEEQANRVETACGALPLGAPYKTIVQTIKASCEKIYSATSVAAIDKTVSAGKLNDMGDQLKVGSENMGSAIIDSPAPQTVEVIKAAPPPVQNVEGLRTLGDVNLAPAKPGAGTVLKYGAAAAVGVGAIYVLDRNKGGNPSSRADGQNTNTETETSVTTSAPAANKSILGLNGSADLDGFLNDGPKPANQGAGGP